jgi:hypothetical protein
MPAERVKPQPKVYRRVHAERTREVTVIATSMGMLNKLNDGYACRWGRNSNPWFPEPPLRF